MKMIKSSSKKNITSKGKIFKILTNREVEYLVLAAMGYKNIEIANVLSVTKSTVKKTFEKVFRKLQAKDRTNAVTLAFLHDILNPKTLSDISEKYNAELMLIDEVPNTRLFVFKPNI